MGIILGYTFSQIVFYPYGGVTKFNLPLNIPIKKELLILIMGPIFQIGGYILLKTFFDNLNLYHYSLLIFNLLPIYPLDGGKIMNALLGMIYSYLKSFCITFYLSIVFLFLLCGLCLWHFNLNLLLIMVILLVKLLKTYQQRYYYYNRFLLERYLNNYVYFKIKNIQSIYHMYRDTFHLVNGVSEKKVLNNYFKKKL